MEFKDVIQWVFFTLITGMGGVVTATLRSLTASVNELNVQIAMVIEKTLNHEKALDRHEKRLDYLERNKGE